MLNEQMKPADTFKVREAIASSDEAGGLLFPNQLPRAATW